VVPGYGKIAEMDETKEEFQIEDAPFMIQSLGRPTVAVCCTVIATDLPDLKGTENNHLRLMTVRSEGQFNTVVYEEEDLYRNQERRDLILIHPDDLKRLGLTERSTRHRR
jgi:anaerobic selenocysteine-containing dehydrogenase